MNVFQLNTARSAVFLRAADTADGASGGKLATAWPRRALTQASWLAHVVHAIPALRWVRALRRHAGKAILDRRDAEARARPADAAGLLTVPVSPTSGTDEAHTPDDANEAAWEPLAEGRFPIGEHAWHPAFADRDRVRNGEKIGLRQATSRSTSRSSG